MDKVRVGVIGLGNMGSVHSKKISGGDIEGMELAAVCDINPERLEWAAENLPECVVKFADAAKLIKSGLTDAVIIATPHYLHPPIAIMALRGGLHVLSEKPAGVYTKQVREMNEAAAESGMVFAIMLNQRTDHLYRKMKEIVQGGELGQIKRTNWIITNWYRPQFYYDSSSWRATWAGEGGGVLLNQCPHNLDLWQWICGMPSKVTAFCHEGKWHDIECEDDVTAYVEYPNGATGVFITSTADAPGTNRFEVTMEGGKLVCENGKLLEYRLDVSEREFNKTCKEPFASPRSECKEVETDGLSPQHVGVLKSFAGAILHGEPLIAKGCEGINALMISNSMHLSSWLGKTVELPVDEDLFYTELQKKVFSSKLKNVKQFVTDTSGSYNS